jgi:peptidoglycan/xylan/chitin deacetylase (PgdA/CDA1 family)
MRARLERYIQITEEFDAKPTLPITAKVLQRHQQLIRQLSERGVEFSIHGLVHNDHLTLNADQQLENIEEAVRIFADAGVPAAGFRGPYLRSNQATDDAVRSLGLLYQSSAAVAFPILKAEAVSKVNSESLQRVLDFYQARDACEFVVRPRNRQGLVDIPVALPDDEILVDRFHLGEELRSQTWREMLQQTHHRGELFTIQLHPERISEMARSLRQVLQVARQLQPSVWIARLDEIASWWLRRAVADVRLEALNTEGYLVELRAHPDVTLLIRGLPSVPTEPWLGRDQVALRSIFEVRTRVKPVVGVSSRSSEPVREFLREEGFPFEISDKKSEFGHFVDLPAQQLDQVELLAELDSCPGPLVRVWRWPNRARSALAVTGDIDSLTLQDFALRLWECRSRNRSSVKATASVVSAREPSHVSRCRAGIERRSC